MKIAGTSLKPLEFWRDDVSLSEARSFATSLLTSFVRGARGARVGKLGARPDQPLTLFSIENCPFSRLVREALSELDIDVLIKPCPTGEVRHWGELEKVGHSEVPYLVDPNHGIKLAESTAIVEYLFRTYGDGPVPVLLSGRGVSLESSKLASQFRGGVMHFEAPGLVPERPLELFSYEASPYCRLVRERLDRLGIAYLTHNRARNSPRRAQFEREHGKLQFPYLFDPNTGTGMFETDLIIAYLDDSYARAMAQTSAKNAAKKRSAQRARPNPG